MRTKSRFSCKCQIAKQPMLNSCKHIYRETHACLQPISLVCKISHRGIFLGNVHGCEYTHHHISSSAQFAGCCVLTTQPCPSRTCDHYKRQPLSEIDMQLQLSLSAGSDLVCVRLCVSECGTGNFPLSPPSPLVDNHFLKQTSGSSPLSLDLFMAQAEPLNLKGFWMENSTLFS